MTQGPRFEWDEGNPSHLSRHDVTPEEAEQVVTRDPIVLEAQIRNGERRV